MEWYWDWDCNDNEINEWYEGHQKRKAQKAKIKDELMPIAWHPSRWWDWCVPKDEKKETENFFFLTFWYAQIKNVLIKQDVKIWSKIDYNQRLLWTKRNNWYIYDRCKRGGGLW